MSHHHPQQLQKWLASCRGNLAKFRQNRHALSKEEQIKFIQDQYLILRTGIKVVKGHARFEGV
jgi:hypothetical protein